MDVREVEEGGLEQEEVEEEEGAGVVSVVCRW